MPDRMHDEALIDRYLNGRMSVDERTAFEIRLLDDAVLLEQVQLVGAMKTGLQAHRETLRSQPAAATGFRLIPFRLWVQQPLSLAAALLIATFGWQLARVKAPDAGMATPSSAVLPEAVPVGSVVQLEYSRGSETPVFTGASPYLLKLDAGLGNEATVFALTLKDAQQHIVLVQGSLAVDSEGWVRVVVPGLAAGSYEAMLAWADASGTAQSRSFPFSIAR